MQRVKTELQSLETLDMDIYYIYYNSNSIIYSIYVYVQDDTDPFNVRQ